MSVCFSGSGLKILFIGVPGNGSFHIFTPDISGLTHLSVLAVQSISSGCILSMMHRQFTCSGSGMYGLVFLAGRSLRQSHLSGFDSFKLSLPYDFSRLIGYVVDCVS